MSYYTLGDDGWKAVWAHGLGHLIYMCWAAGPDSLLVCR